MWTADRASSFAKAAIFDEKLRRGETAGQGIERRKVMGVSGMPDDDDGFAALAQLESAYRVKGFASRGLVGLF
jgi:hypothetical protein